MVGAVKRAAVEAVEAAKPVQVIFGTVVSGSPLAIQIEQRFVLDAHHLILTRNVTDHKVQMAVSHQTEADGAFSHGHTVTTSQGSGSAASHTQAAHTHEYKGIKEFEVKNALKPGERVLLLRMQGGNQYIVWDRLGE